MSATSREGQTPLMTAARTGKLDAVEALLAHGAAVDAAEGFRGQTALMWAAGEGHLDVVTALVDAGANVNAKSKAGSTPLLFAVRETHVDTLRYLLDHGANANDLAPDGTSALNVAIVNAFYEAASRAARLPGGPEPARRARLAAAHPSRGCASRAPRATPASAICRRPRRDRSAA